MTHSSLSDNTLNSQFWPLDDWVVTLELFQSNMHDLEKFRQKTGFTPCQSMVTENVNDVSLQAMLYKALHGLHKKSKGMIMLQNLQTAAFHLSFMLRGFQTSDRLVCISVFPAILVAIKR